jgi:hypothetical protein
MEMSWMTLWVRDNVAMLTVGGAYFSGTMLLGTVIANLRLTRAMKKTDTVVACGQTFNTLMNEKHRLRRTAAREAANGLPAVTAEDLRKETLDFYGQFFSFQFTEFIAFKSGNLDRKVFALWMKSRRKEYLAGEAQPKPELIHGVTCKQGWDNWLERWHHNEDDDFKKLMNEVHTTDKDIGELVRRYGPPTQKAIAMARSIWPRKRATGLGSQPPAS